MLSIAFIILWISGALGRVVAPVIMWILEFLFTAVTFVFGLF